MRRTFAGSFALLWLAACSGEERGPCRPEPGPGELGTVCGFQNPEDVAFDPSAGVLLVTQMVHWGGAGGAVAALSLDASGAATGPPRTLWPDPDDPLEVGDLGDPDCTVPPTAEDFEPHGLTLAPRGGDGATRVAVVNHGAREAVELFDLIGRGDESALRWRGCVVLPENAAGNDAVLAPDGAILVTDYQPTMDPPLRVVYGILAGMGLDTGEVLRWTRGGGWRGVPGTTGRGPNGLLLAPDGETVYAAMSAASTLRVSSLTSSADEAVDVELPGFPDNLSWGRDGSVLVIVHTAADELVPCQLGAAPCRASWALVAIDPAKPGVREVFRHDGEAVGGVASAVEAGERVYFGSIFDDRIGVWNRGASSGQ